MGLHTRKQLSELLKLDWTNKSHRDKIGMWVKRGSIIEKEGLIDDTDPQNVYWLNKQMENVVKRTEDEVTTKLSSALQPVHVNVNKVSENKINKNTERKSSNSPGGNHKFELEVEKKQLEIEKLKVDTRLQELKEEKIRGEVLPISLTKGIVMTLHQSIITSQKDNIDYLLIRISKEFQLSGEQLARLRGEMIKSLNVAAEKAIKASQRNIKLLMDEFSIKKEVGEHD